LFSTKLCHTVHLWENHVHFIIILHKNAQVSLPTVNFHGCLSVAILFILPFHFHRVILVSFLKFSCYSYSYCNSCGRIWMVNFLNIERASCFLLISSYIRMMGYTFSSASWKDMNNKPSLPEYKGKLLFNYSKSDLRFMRSSNVLMQGPKDNGCAKKQGWRMDFFQNTREMKELKAN
jgi:hypothetical protein